MFESNSKLPKIFVYMLTSVAVFMLAGLFFGVKFVGMPYFISMIICVILLVLDKKSNSNVTNYKLTYLLLGLINFIAVSSIIYYEYSKHTEHLNLFLILLVDAEVLMAIIDVFILKNKNLTKRFNLVIDVARLCSMICIMTYFFGISDLYFAIFAFVFEIANISIKVSTHFISRKKEDVKEENVEKLEDIIHSSDEENGE